MKTWIIVLAVVFVILKICEILLANFIRNDKTERMKYYFLDGATPLGVTHGFIHLFSILVGSADAILLFVYLLNLI